MQNISISSLVTDFPLFSVRGLHGSKFSDPARAPWGPTRCDQGNSRPGLAGGPAHVDLYYLCLTRQSPLHI